MDPPLTIWELANIELIPLQEHLDTSTISHVGKIEIFFPQNSSRSACLPCIILRNQS